jgi:atypical dual specificity phosphatase
MLFDDLEDVASLPTTLTAGKVVTKIVTLKKAEKRSYVANFIKKVRYLIYIVIEEVRNTVAGAPIYKYSQVLPKLYVGGTIRKKAVKEFNSWGVHAIVNMQETKDPNLGKKFCYLHLPTRDMTAPSLESIERGVDYIRKNIRDGKGVYIHCRHGRGRGPTMTAAYLITEHGMTVDQAIDHLHSVRPMTQILKLQKRALQKYYEKIKHTP